MRRGGPVGVEGGGEVVGRQVPQTNAARPMPLVPLFSPPTWGYSVGCTMRPPCGAPPAVETLIWSLGKGAECRCVCVCVWGGLFRRRARPSPSTTCVVHPVCAPRHIRSLCRDACRPRDNSETHTNRHHRTRHASDQPSPALPPPLTSTIGSGRHCGSGVCGARERGARRAGESGSDAAQAHRLSYGGE